MIYLRSGPGQMTVSAKVSDVDVGFYFFMFYFMQGIQEVAETSEVGGDERWYFRSEQEAESL